MNKYKLRKDLAEMRIEIETIDFSEEGHRLRLRLISSSYGWVDFEYTPIDGFEVVSPREINDVTRKYTFVPANEVEFKYYIQKYVNTYGLSRKTAMTELERIVRNTGNVDAINKFNSFKKWG